MQTIETERLILRRFTPDDAEQYFPLITDPEINLYTGQALAKTVDEARQILLDYTIRDYEQYGHGRMECIEKSSGRLVGFSGTKYLTFWQEVDVGYRFLRDSWGKGYATESASVLMRQCIREFGLRRVIGLTRGENTASANTLKSSACLTSGRFGVRGIRECWICMRSNVPRATDASHRN